MKYLQDMPSHYDLCLASGVLYHLIKPVEVIALASKVADYIFIWTHYYDRDIVAKDAKLAARFNGVSPSEHAGFRHRLYRYEYGAALDFLGFCGGSRQYSNWMTKTDILSCLQHFGYVDVEQSFDDPHHPNGPSFALLARQRSAPLKDSRTLSPPRSPT